MIKIKSLRIILILTLFFFSAGGHSAEKEGRWWSLYFTSPGEKIDAAATPEAGFIKLIGKAGKTFYGAFFEISSEKIIKELIDAAARGVDIELVIDEDNFHNKEVRKLINAGIPIVNDKRSGLMHKKFAVVDVKYVWTGSYNLTGNCSYRNNNNAILILSEGLADIYLKEFTEMFKYRIFGNKKEPGIFVWLQDNNTVKIDGTDINVYFSPEDNIEKKIINCLQAAKKSIDFLAFSFTSNKIGEKVIEKYKEGLAVRGIFEKIGSNTIHSEYTKMVLEKIPVRLDKNRHRMHHKVIVIDGMTVIMGSYNYSKSADKQNDENILIINNREIAAEYLKEFERLYK